MRIAFCNSKFSFVLIAAIITANISYADAKEYLFDPEFLKSSGDIDLTLFEEGGQPPGTYKVDIILNGSTVDSREMPFYTERNDEGKPYLKTCISREMLIRYGVKIEKYPNLFPRIENDSKRDSDVCANLSVIPQATEFFYFNNQQLILEIPQIALRPKYSNVAPDILWDDGISAFLLNWKVDVSKTKYDNNKKYDKINNGWGSLESGVNLGSWRLRNMMTWNKTSDHSDEWDSLYTRAERGFNSIKSRLILGEAYTPSDVFDSVPFLGVMLGTDESMTPYNMREFAPVISGIARTQSRIEVRQDGFLIYSITVAPGAFSITDLPVSGSGGDLHVSILGTDGDIKTFTVPFTTPAIALREGYLKYNFTSGQYRSADSSVKNSYWGQATAMYGLPKGMTIFGGAQIAESYKSAALGIGASLGNLGALSVDTIYANSKMNGGYNESGNTWRVRYNKSFNLTGSSFSVASYQYSSENYYSLSEVLESYKNGEEYIYNNNVRRSRRTSLTLSQSLDRFGYIRFFGNRDEYHNGRPHDDSMGMSYSTTWKDVSLSINWTINRTSLFNSGLNEYKTENNINFYMSVPLERWLGNKRSDIRASTQIQHISNQGSVYEVGLNGRAFDRQLQWNVSKKVASGSATQSDNGHLGLIWNGTYGSLNGMYSYSDYAQQMNAGMSGSVIIHDHGIAFGQQSGDTLALVSAPGVKGGGVGGWPGVKTDNRGYALTGYLSPYQENLISIDPRTLPKNTDVLQTDKYVVPTKGAIVKANFDTRIGGRALVTLRRADGRFVPFGTIVTVVGENGNNNAAGIVGNNGEVYMSGLKEKGKLVAKWGASESCYAHYELPKLTGSSDVFLARSVCM